MLLRFFSFLRALRRCCENIPLRGYARKFFFCVCALFFCVSLRLCACFSLFVCFFRWNRGSSLWSRQFTTDVISFRCFIWSKHSRLSEFIFWKKGFRCKCRQCFTCIQSNFSGPKILRRRCVHWIILENLERNLEVLFCIHLLLITDCIQIYAFASFKPLCKKHFFSLIPLAAKKFSFIYIISCKI